MRKIMKRALALLLAASTLLALLLLVSCGTKGEVEGFLTSDNYTFKAGKLTIKVDKSTVYYSDGNVEKYLFLDKSVGRYFYAEIGKDKKIVKEKLDSEKYIIYHGEILTIVSSTTTLLTGFLQVADTLEEVDGVYTVGDYTVKSADGVITLAMGKNTAEISSVGSTTVEVPENVMKASAK